MKPGLLLFFSLLSSITLIGQEQKNDKTDVNWKLIYANDETGKKIHGDLAKLIDAVRTGVPVRISWTIEHPTNKKIKVEHFADAKFVTIMSDSIVFAQIDPIVGQSPSIKDKFITLKENIEWCFSASSLGNNDSMNRNKKTGEIIDHNQFKCGIKWFIKPL